MKRLPARISFTVIATSMLLAATQAQSAPASVDYSVAATGQSARATFDFFFAASQIAGGSVIVGSGSTTVGFRRPPPC
jgi:hypothetical protein